MSSFNDSTLQVAAPGEALIVRFVCSIVDVIGPDGG